MKTFKDYLEMARTKGIESLETIESKNKRKMDLIDAYLISADPADLYDLLADFNITEEDDISNLEEDDVREYVRDYMSDLSIEAIKDVLGMD